MARFLSRSQVDTLRATNSTTAYTVGTFTAPTVGSFLVLASAGGVTQTTPTGWALVTSSVSAQGIYLFTKTAAGTETSYATTANSVSYPIGAVMYEFPAGSTLGTSATSGATGIGRAVANPSVTPTAGQTAMALVSNTNPAAANTFTNVTWSGVTNLAVDYVVDVSGIGQTTDGYLASIAYLDNAPASAFAPVGDVGATTTQKQALTWTVNVTGPYRYYTSARSCSRPRLVPANW